MEPVDARPAPACYARIAVERGIDIAQSTLTYSHHESLAVGERVEVPLGNGNKIVGGIVVEVGGPELADGYKLERIKLIAVRTGAALSPALMDLARWISEYYVCPLGMVLANMMPAAVKQGVGRKTRTELDRTPNTTPDLIASLKPAARHAWDAIAALPSTAFPSPAPELKNHLSLATLGPLNQLVRAGLLVEVRRTVVSAATPSWETGTVESKRLDAPPPTLMPEQQQAVDAIVPTLDRFGVHLLFGVTGSGKTEVYLRLIEQALAAGRSAMVLVPEISLTPQTAARFEARFRREGVAVLHSGLSAARRHQHWAAVASGAARVVVGARSAVFAPLPDLGIIVVDEEHDAGYKQDQLPRYHARDVAIMRAHLANIPIILGSATPSLESWRNAATKRYSLHRLTQRAANARLPAVTVVDMAAEAKLRARIAGPDARIRNEQIGPTLERAILDTLQAGAQVILLLNRRGYANFISCPNPKCGWVMTCTDCDAAMVHHKSTRANPRGGYVRCHHCLAEQMLPTACPHCASRVNLLGTGTQRVEEELAKKFAIHLGGQRGDGPDNLPALRRFDSDAMQTARDYHQVLTRFASGEIRMLIGTQMVAKGLDFPNVRLVGVINADTALTLADFRASERTFQLVSQVAGRAGRGNGEGRVIVQTAAPQTAAIRFAAGHDYVSFAEDEWAHRAHAGLPPLTRMARIVVRDEDLPKAEQHAAELAQGLADAAQGTDLVIDGPGPCAIARISGFHRIELVLTSRRRSVIQDVLGALRRQGMLVSDARTAIDVDPIAMM